MNETVFLDGSKLLVNTFTNATVYVGPHGTTMTDVELVAKLCNQWQGSYAHLAMGIIIGYALYAVLSRCATRWPRHAVALVWFAGFFRILFEVCAFFLAMMIIGVWWYS